MKKSLLALAVLAASGAAMAQSSVTLFGIVDTNVGYVNHADAAGKKNLGLGHSGNATSRIGFRGVEDLGGGLKAGFWLEAGITPDDGGAKSGGATSGGLEFKRRSTVSLMGNFGEVRLGRELAPSYSKLIGYDVFGQVGVGQFYGWKNWVGATTADADGVRQSNMISYYTPNFSGFTAGLGYGFDEQTVGKNGRYIGGYAAYDNGPLSVTFALDRRDVNVNVSNVGIAATKDSWTLGGSYNLNVVKLNALLQQNKYKALGESGKYNAYAFGVTAPVGAGEVRAQYALYDQKDLDSKSHQFSVGYVHNMSKRTALYGTLAYVKNKDFANVGLAAGGVANAGPGAGNNQTGMQVGVRHAF